MAKSTDGLKPALRRLMADGQWWNLARACEMAGREVTAEQAMRYYSRLVQAGGRKVDERAEQLAIGRERAIREVLQRLVHDGRAEAVGEGNQRVYRLMECGMSAAKPKPERKYIPLERLTFDPRLQMRDLPEGVVYVEQTVAHYVELHAEGAEFPPPDVVSDGKMNWVIAGFNRGEMYRRRQVASIECLVYEGNFQDAQLWALSENSRHGLTRTPADCRRAFETLVSDKGLLKKVLDGSKETKEESGIQRKLARACGLSVGAVGKYLPDFGLKADRKTGKLIAIEPTPAPKSPRSSTPAASPPPPPAEEAAAPPREPTPWRDRHPKEALKEELPPKLLKALGDTYDSCAELTDRLLAGESLGLGRADLTRLYDAIEELARQNGETIRFGLKPEETILEQPAVPIASDARFEGSGSTPSVSHAQDLLVEAQKLLRALNRTIEPLLKGPAADTLRAAAARHSIPFSVKESEPPVFGNQSSMVKTEWWPTLASLTAVFADTAASAFQTGAA